RPRTSTKPPASPPASRRPGSDRSRFGRSWRSGASLPRPMSLEGLYREEGGRILATLIRVVGDFDLAEEVMHEAFAAALAQWPGHGIPDHPRAWLVATARHKAIDRLRRDARFRERRDDLARWEALREGAPPDFEDAADGRIADDRLRLIFTCCHPSLALE